MTLTKQHVQLLRMIQHCPKKVLKDLLSKCGKNGIKAICEVCMNTLKGNVPLTPTQKQTLHQHKNTLRALSRKKTPLYKKRKLLIQKGGFLGVLIPAALSVLTTLLTK